MTFSMPSPVELTQLKIQYQRNVGTPRASNRIELGATVPAPGSTSNASTFLSATSERVCEPAAAGGTGERGVREPRVPRGPATRSERSERRERRGGCGERAPPNRGQDPRSASGLRREAARLLSLLLGLLDALAVGERVLHGREFRERLPARVFHAAAECWIARAASRKVSVAAGGPDRVHDATERARLL